jgi:REP element-mobilizing transposase RayT
MLKLSWAGFEAYIHMFVSIPPRLSIIKLMQYLNGKTSHKMLFEFKPFAASVIENALE